VNLSKIFVDAVGTLAFLFLAYISRSSY